MTEETARSQLETARTQLNLMRFFYESLAETTSKLAGFSVIRSAGIETGKALAKDYQTAVGISNWKIDNWKGFLKSVKDFLGFPIEILGSGDETGIHITSCPFTVECGSGAGVKCMFCWAFWSGAWRSAFPNGDAQVHKTIARGNSYCMIYFSEKITARDWMLGVDHEVSLAFRDLRRSAPRE